MDNTQRWIYTAVAAIASLVCVRSVLHYFHEPSIMVDNSRFQINAHRVVNKDFPVWVTVNATLNNDAITSVYAPSGTTRLIYWNQNQKVDSGQVVAVFEDQQGRSMGGLQQIVNAKKEHLNRQREVYKQDAKDNGIDPAKIDEYVNNISAVANAHQEYFKAEQELAAYIAQCVVYAPANGRTSASKIPQGSSVQNGSMVGEFYMNVTQPTVEGYVTEQDAKKIRNGNPAVFILPGADESYIGHVYSVDPIIDKDHCGVKVKAQLTDQGNSEFRGRATGKLKIRSGVVESIPVIPTASLIEIGGGRHLVIQIINYDRNTGYGLAKYSQVGANKKLESYGWTPVNGLSSADIVSTIMVYTKDGDLLAGVPVAVLNKEELYDDDQDDTIDIDPDTEQPDIQEEI